MIRRTILIFGAAVAALVCAGSLQAAIISQTFYMNQSNALSDDKDYGVVKIDADAVAGTVKFTVTAPYVYAASKGSNYGFKNFLLNTNDLVLGSTKDFDVEDVPTDWEIGVGKNNTSEFGGYSYEFNAKTGNATLETLNFTFKLAVASKATIANFANKNGPDSTKAPKEYFAAHIIDIANTGKVTSHQVAGSVPEPSTIVLWSLVGVGGLAFARRFRKK